jgi:hypothetical protein
MGRLFHPNLHHHPRALAQRTPQQMADGSNIRHQWKLPKESD